MHSGRRTTTTSKAGSISVQSPSCTSTSNSTKRAYLQNTNVEESFVLSIHAIKTTAQQCNWSSARQTRWANECAMKHPPPSLANRSLKANTPYAHDSISRNAKCAVKGAAGEAGEGKQDGHARAPNF